MEHCLAFYCRDNRGHPDLDVLYRPEMVATENEYDIRSLMMRAMRTDTPDTNQSATAAATRIFSDPDVAFLASLSRYMESFRPPPSWRTRTDQLTLNDPHLRIDVRPNIQALHQRQ